MQTNLSKSMPEYSNNLAGSTGTGKQNTYNQTNKSASTDKIFQQQKSWPQETDSNPSQKIPPQSTQMTMLTRFPPSMEVSATKSRSMIVRQTSPNTSKPKTTQFQTHQGPKHSFQTNNKSSTAKPSNIQLTSCRFSHIPQQTLQEPIISFPEQKPMGNYNISIFQGLQHHTRFSPRGYDHSDPRNQYRQRNLSSNNLQEYQRDMNKRGNSMQKPF